MREKTPTRKQRERIRTRRAVRIVAGLALASAALVAFLVWRKGEPKWSVVVEAEDTTVTPWMTTRLAGKIAPKRALDRPGWHWTWTDNGTTFATETMVTEWKGSTLGTHDLSLSVASPWGTRRTASVAVTVVYKEYVTPIGPQAGSTLKSDPTPAALPFGIKDVWIEKRSVCIGEPTRIRLTPFDRRGEEKWLIPEVGDSAGWEGVFVPSLTELGVRAVPVQVADYRETAGSRGGAASTFAMIEVKDCMAPFPMYLTWRSIPPKQEYVRFDARLFDGPAWDRWSETPTRENAPPPIAHAASYRWDTGDGRSVTTGEPTLSHQYPPEAERPDELATTYAAKVEALDPSGNVMATAYSHVHLRNALRELKHNDGVVQLVTEKVPWSDLNEDGSRTVAVTLVNIDLTETVTLASDADVSLKACDGEKATHRAVALSSIFGDSVLAPKQRIQGRFTISKEDVDAICWADVALKGKTSPGQFAATGYFGLDCGKQSQKVASREKGHLLVKAMQLLGNPSHVSMDDVHRLEDEGKLPRGALTPGR
jgi:hypothetical protein